MEDNEKTPVRIDIEALLKDLTLRRMFIIALKCMVLVMAGLLGVSQPTLGAEGRFVNLSTRALVETGEEIMIGGFIIEDGARRVLIQALGPELADRGISNALVDPVLTVTNTTDPDNPIEIMVNDNWEDDQGQFISDLWGDDPPLTAGSLSAAAALTLEPGNYTAKVEGKDGTAGVAIVEVYEIDSPGGAGKFVNISTRALVETGEEVMIGGFIIEDGFRQVLIQALGPELAIAGISNALADPVLTVTNTTDPDNPVEIIANDNWEDIQGQLVTNLWGGSPNLTAGSLSAAAVLILETGNYTAKVEGKSGTAGVALVEVYEIDPPVVGNPEDFAALTALYYATDGVNWRNRDNWLTGEPLENWYGVEVNAGGRVVRVELADNNLFGTLPPELGQLSHLESLLLKDNYYLTGSIPPELGNLAQLREFSLSGASVTGAIPPELGNLSNLNTLELTFNTLTGAIPAELGNLSNLKRLKLDRNELTGAIPPELGNLSQLKELSIEANKFEVGPEPGEGSDSSGTGPSRSSVTGLTGAIPPELANLSMLEILRLSKNSLTGSIPPELSGLSNLKMLSLAQNDLAGGVPPELGRLSTLQELNLAHNADLAGVLPASLTDLGELDAFLAAGTGLCAPSNPGFTDWLAGLTRRRIAICEAEQTLAYLTQAVQSRPFPVPLVAGEAALLRVFVTAPGGTDASIPPVRATFYLGGAEAHIADIPGQSTAIPAQIDESSLAKSANAEIPAEVVQPGLEMVIEIDPESTLDPGLGIVKRIPEQGRAKVEVREMPPFELTVIPFLWSTNPDSSVLDIGGADDDFFWPTHTLLPIEEFRVDKHEPVITSSNDSYALLEETRAIRVMEGGTGYYIGILSGERGDGPRGLAELSLPLAFAVADPFVVAHEFGHNMGLLHAPCGIVLFGDTGYPHPNGSIGAFGYDFRDGGKLVPPSTPDLMTYCSPQWIGDYHFGNALAFRLLKEEEATAAFEMVARTILLWGGVDNAGAPFLEPAFVVDAPPFLPPSRGAYEITGRSKGGDTLFSMSFDMPEMADGDGRSGFAFALPTRGEWAAALASITLKGPGGSATLDRNSNHPMKILRNPRTGQVRGILRGRPEAASPQDDHAAAVHTAPDLEELFSRGIPDATAW